jgi:hypothetical protein
VGSENRRPLTIVHDITMQDRVFTTAMRGYDAQVAKNGAHSNRSPTTSRSAG